MHRRNVLRVSGVSLLAGVAGCTGLTDGSGDDPAGEATTVSGDGSNTASTADGPGLDDHPSAAGIRDQPRLGDLDGHVIVAFEDPSCPNCRRFEENTVPKIQSNLVDEGKAAYVFRGYPVVYPWGRPASHALEATYDRDADAFWSLVDYYFDNQPDLNGDNVVDRTEQFLDGETSVDGAAVRSDVGDDAYADAVQTDLDAGEEADATSTPTVFLFRDGEYLTKASGTVSYDVIETALGE